MGNRFLEMDNYLKQLSGKKGQKVAINGAFASSQFSLWAQPLSATDRTLVILIENGGVDLGIPDLVDKLLSLIPGGDLVPETYRKKLIDTIRDKITKFTDNLIETVELSANRYTAAKPDYFGDVVVLRDGTASYNDLKGKLIALSQAGKIIDLFILTHGRDKFISVTGDISDQKIRDMKAENGKPLSIRSVYMMNCVGSSLNQAWIDAGAKVSSGSLKNNYLPEPTMYFFWKNWQDGQPFETAVISAYRKTINLLNETVQALVKELPIPSIDILASTINFEDMDFVKDSAPVIQGQRTVTINTDDLSFTQSTSSSLATTVLPVNLLRAFGDTQKESGGQKAPYTVSQQGIDFIKKWEGFSPTLYNDPVGHCTVGYGTLLHTGNCDGRASEQPYTKGISEEKANQLLTKEISEFQKTINETVSVSLNQNQNDALVSFIYNVGGSNFRRSTLLRLLNQGNYAAVPTELRKWTKAHQNGQIVDLPGLVKRRNAEAELFQSAITNQKPSTGQSFSKATTITRTFASPFGFSAADWEGLISFRPPTAVQSGVKSKGFGWHVHRIEDGYSDINLDYYPVSVTRLPTVSGRLLTAEEFLSYIRLNINSFVDTNNSKFAAYDSAEATVWTSGTPLGSVVHIDMKSAQGWLNLDDGSVVVSEFASDHWIFSTIWTVLDQAHPVSGNRQFGFTRGDNGSYVFYTKGADRTTGLLDAAAMSVVFAAANDLWLSLQQGIAGFVNRNGGSASIEPATSVRTPWPSIQSTYHHPTVAWL